MKTKPEVNRNKGGRPKGIPCAWKGQKRPGRKKPPKKDKVPIFSNKQKAWADRYMETGNAQESAAVVYGTGMDTHAARRYASALGSRNKNNPTIKKYMESSVELASKTITFLAQNADNERVRLAAAQDILDRLGFKAADNLIVEDKRKLNDEDYEAIRRVQSILAGVRIEDVPPVKEAIIIEEDPYEEAGPFSFGRKGADEPEGSDIREVGVEDSAAEQGEAR